MWDHWPSETELRELQIHPQTRWDQWGNIYSPLPPHAFLRAVCTCCGADFAGGGYYAYAPQSGTLYRILVCPAHLAAKKEGGE